MTSEEFQEIPGGYELTSVIFFAESLDEGNREDKGAGRALSGVDFTAEDIREVVYLRVMTEQYSRYEGRTTLRALLLMKDSRLIQIKGNNSGPHGWNCTCCARITAKEVKRYDCKMKELIEEKK